MTADDDTETNDLLDLAPEDEELLAEQERLGFLAAMERGRANHEQAIISTAQGWYDNMVSVRHANALQEAILRMRAYDRDYLRKYVRKFRIHESDPLHLYLTELEAKLG